MEKFENPKLKFIKETDKIAFFTAIIASVYGLMLVYSATHSSLKEGQLISSDIRTMVISITLGVVFAIIVSNIDYEIISKLWPVIALGCVALMIITRIWGVAPNARDDARSWLKIGSFTFQSSELLKVGFIISFAYHIDLVKNKINEFKHILLLCVHGAVPIGLVIITGDMGSALIFIIMFVGMLFMANIRLLYFIAGGALALIGAVLAWNFEIKPFSGLQRERILGLFFPEEYVDVMYQQTNAKIAMGSGGLFGKGYLQGTYTQGGKVPENQNDMILSVAGEEFGFIGAAIVLLLLIILIVRIFFNGFKARDNVGFMMCCGVAIMLFAQLFVNVGMELSILPCIGITLPLFSAGGSSSLSVYIAIGLVLSIHRFSQVPNDMMFFTRRA